MTWADAKQALSLVLDGLTATIPDGDDGDVSARAVQAVFKQPPASIEKGNLPCIVFGESTLSDDWGPGLSSQNYELTCSLMLRDEDIARAVEWTEAFRDAVMRELWKNTMLGAAATVVNGARFTAAQDVFDGARNAYTGFQFTLPIVIEETVNFAVGDGAHP